MRYRPMTDSMHRDVPTSDAALRPLNPLTRNQRTILQMIESGFTLKCLGDPATTRKAWTATPNNPCVRVITRKTLDALLATGAIEVETLRRGQAYTVFKLTTK